MLLPRLTVLDLIHFALHTSHAADLIWVVCAVVLQAGMSQPCTTEQLAAKAWLQQETGCSIGAVLSSQQHHETAA
jgi:hypothetical protein